MEREGDGERRRWRYKEVVTSLMNEMRYMLHIQILVVRNPNQNKKKIRVAKGHAQMIQFL